MSKYKAVLQESVAQFLIFKIMFRKIIIMFIIECFVFTQSLFALISPNCTNQNFILPFQFQDINPSSYITLQNEIVPDKKKLDLTGIFQANLRYFLDFGVHPETKLPYDNVTMDTQGNLHPTSHTSVTNIGLQLAGLIAGNGLGIISEDELINKVKNILDTIDKLKVYEGEGEFEGKKYLYNWYDLNTLEPTEKWISSVDLAWFVSGLIVTNEAIKENYPEISQRLENWIKAIDFSLFYNKSSGLMRTGYKVKSFGLIPAGEYPSLNSESRMISYLAIGKKDISEEEAKKHWQALDRSRADKEQNYGLDIIGSWGGAAFEFGMPALFVDEMNLGKTSFEYNFKKAMLVQILQSIDKNYLIWGESPSSTPYYDYKVYGSSAGIHPFHSEGVITPHASLLALSVLEEKVFKNLKVMKVLFPEAFDSKYGIVDAIDTNTNRPVFKYLALDQAMATLSLANVLNNNIIVKLFHKSEIGKNIESFIENEQFFTDEGIENEINQIYETAKMVLEKDWFKSYTLLNFLQNISSDFNYFNINGLQADIERAKAIGINEYEDLIYSASSLIDSQDYSNLLQARENLKKAITWGIWLGINNEETIKLFNEVREKIKTISPRHPKLPGLVVSDFNDLAKPTEHMEGLFEWTTGSAFTDIIFEETTEPEHRVVMKLDYLVISDTETGVIMKLKDVDLKDYNYLVFDVKSAPTGFGEKFKIELKYQGGNWPFPSYEVDNITTEWKKVYIPLDELAPTIPEDKLNKITELATVFDIDSGTIYIDNVHFE